MMKRLHYTAWLAIMLALSACGGGTGANAPAEGGTPTESEAPAESPLSPESETPADDKTSAETPDMASPVYYGEWTVEEAVGAAEISTGVDESMIGKKAAYSAEAATFGTEVAPSPPVYEEGELTNAEFAAEYRAQLSAIGIEADIVKTVTVADWTSPGSLLLIKDDQTLITLWDGTFYAMKKSS